MTIGQRCKAYRESHRTAGGKPMSQEAFARLLGPSLWAVRSWENGVSDPIGFYREAIEKRLTELESAQDALETREQ